MGLPPSSTKATSKEAIEPSKKGSLRPMGTELADANALGQLREILVGGFQRELERRLARADAHVSARAHDLEMESRRRTEVVETYMRRETEVLTARIERELLERGDTLRAMAREHRESMSALEQRVGKLEDALVSAQREMRHQLLDQAKRFLDELQRLKIELTETLERELGLSEVLFDEAGGGEQERPTP